MPRSMTGFASFRGGFEAWRYSGDIRSVNGRGLDMRMRVPDWIEGLEPGLRKALQARLARGSVTISMRVARDDSAPDVHLNEAQLDAALTLISAIEEAAMVRGVGLAPTRATDVAQMRGVVEQRDADDQDDTSGLRKAILNDFAGLIEAFDADRAREGAALADVFRGQLDEIETLIAAAKKAVGSRAAAARATLDRGLARLLEATEVPDEARLTQELALIAVKTDVTEEMDRLDAHVVAARGLLAEKGAIGRKLDFLMQEFNREANTLCSKAQSNDLTAIGLDLKAVIDQMREQVQNIE
ncbi:MAG: YicC family protein [Boseongicola sp.]|nr:MAG: YicC family protein [Boseongicola sp.]